MHLAAGNLYGGVETFLSVLARAPRAWEHRFVLFFEGRLAAELRAAGARVDILGPARLGRPWTLLGPQARLRRLVSDWRPHVVLSHSSWMRLAAGPALRGVRVASFLHNPLEAASPIDRVASWFPSDVVLANTAFTAQASAPLLAGRRPALTGYPVEDSASGPGVRSEVRRSLGVAEDTPVIIQVSRMEAWKGQALLLDALARLPPARPWECWVVGGAQRPQEQAYLGQLQRQAERLGLSRRVRFLGQRADIPRLLSGADIFCQPNLGPEPFGIVFVEAMYAGLPVLATDLGGPREIIEPAFGARVAPRADAVAAVLAGWLGRPEERAALGREGRRCAQARYAPAVRVRMLEAALEEGAPTAPQARPGSSAW